MKKKKSYMTDFLFPRTSSLVGAGSVLNIAGHYFAFDLSQIDIDADSIESDWSIIGKDIQSAVDEFEKNLLEKTLDK